MEKETAEETRGVIQTVGPQLIEKISLNQLFVLILLFEIGSTIVVGIGGEARQDTWIAVFIACIIGIGLMAMYCKISSAAPGKHLYEIMEIGFGKWIAILLTVLYVHYFLYLASRVLRDFMELLIADIFPNTPIEVISLLFLFVVMYINYLGIETLSRSAEIFIPYFILFLFLLCLFLIISGELSMQRLRPILAEGWGPVLSSVFPEMITFPFGEAIIFTVILGYTQSFHRVGRIALFGIIASGSMITLWAVFDIAVLGPDTRGRSTFPLLNSIREISIANFIERLDAFVVFIMMLGIFVKVSLYYFGVLKGLEYITNIPYRAYTVPIGILIGVFSIVIAPNYPHHIQEGLKVVPKFLHLPFQIIVPSVLLMTLLFWKGRKRRSGESVSKKVVKAAK